MIFAAAKVHLYVLIVKYRMWSYLILKQSAPEQEFHPWCFKVVNILQECGVLRESN